MSELEKKYNVTVTPNNIKYEAGKFNLTLQVLDNSRNLDEENWNKYCIGLGLTLIDRGRKFEYKKHTYTLTTINPNVKYPIQTLRDDNKIFEFSNEFLLTLLK